MRWNNGFLHLNARYYNPEIGRFLSRDPRLGDDTNRLGKNEYIYAENDPIRNTDPDGLRTKYNYKGYSLKYAKNKADEWNKKYKEAYKHRNDSASAWSKFAKVRGTSWFWYDQVYGAQNAIKTGRNKNETSGKNKIRTKKEKKEARGRGERDVRTVDRKYNNKTPKSVKIGKGGKGKSGTSSEIGGDGKRYVVNTLGLKVYYKYGGAVENGNGKFKAGYNATDGSIGIGARGNHFSSKVITDGRSVGGESSARLGSGRTGINANQSFRSSGGKSTLGGSFTGDYTSNGKSLEHGIGYEIDIDNNRAQRVGAVVGGSVLIGVGVAKWWVTRDPSTLQKGYDLVRNGA